MISVILILDSVILGLFCHPELLEGRSEDNIFTFDAFYSLAFVSYKNLVQCFGKFSRTFISFLICCHLYVVLSS